MQKGHSHFYTADGTVPEKNVLKRDKYSSDVGAYTTSVDNTNY